MQKLIFLVSFLTYLIITNALREKRQDCKQSETTASGSVAPDSFCSGDLIFEDNFDWFDTQKWKRENSLFGFGNREFEWYTDDNANSFAKDGNLFIRPSLTSDYLGSEDKLYYDTIDLGSSCTNNGDGNGCKKTGTQEDILNPVRSTRMNSQDSFRFKYGKVEIRAQMPTGDWLWPALWFFPSDSRYGGWPRSGEIDLAECRGNLQLWQNGQNIGVDKSASTLHWGPDPGHNEYQKTMYEIYKPGDGFNKGFRSYQLEWTPDHITFSVDGQELGTANPGSNFWDYGGFAQQGLTDNPWAGQTKMAPFDQEFFLIINLAIGGNFFPDDAENQPYPKPWKNDAQYPMTDFWKAKDQWLPTWNLQTNDGYDASLKVDYIRVWAL